MKKIVKTITIILEILIFILLIDTVQAKVFDNKPLLKIVEDYNGGNLYQKHKGILVDTYVFTDGNQETVFKWETSREAKSWLTGKSKVYFNLVLFYLTLNIHGKEYTEKAFISMNKQKADWLKIN